MKIAYINETCGTGSIGRTTYELAVELNARGHECLVAHSKGQSRFPNSIMIGCELDHKVHALLSRITGLQGYFSHIATWRLIQRLKKFQPDVVHLRNLHSNCINLKMLLSWLAREDVATVITLHDCWFFTGKCTYYVPAKCEKWQQECGNCPLLHKDNVNPTFWFDRTKKCLKDKKKWLGAIPQLAVTGVSNWVAAEAGRSILADRHPVGIYNWIDLEVFKPRESRLREKHGLEGKFVVLVVSTNLNRIKGYDELTALAQRLPDGWALVAVGRPVLPLPENVIHISHTDDAIQLAEYYSMADVCMNTTQYETFGKVTAEAICCGTPAVVYNNTASPELVDEGCGMVVEQSAGIDGIMEALDEVRRNGKASYTEDCLSAAHRRFAKPIGVEKYERMYRTLVERKQA